MQFEAAPWQRVRPGREVWVTTTTGSLVHGEISAISDTSVNILQRSGHVIVRLDDIRLVEGRDSLKNGMTIGAASGAAVGGLLGAMVDGLIPGRQTLC